MESRREDNFDQEAYEKGYISKSSVDYRIEEYERQIHDLMEALDEANTKVGLYKNILIRLKNQHKDNTKMFDLFLN